MEKIEEMISSAPTKSMAISTLNTWRIFGAITEDEFWIGRIMINNEF